MAEKPKGVPSETPTNSLIVAIDTVGDTADTRDGSRPVWQQYKTLSHDMLLDVDPVKGTLIPGVAESWETSTDGAAWTFKLRKGMKFQDGHEITAEDVQYGLEWQLSEAGTCCAQRWRDIIGEVEIIDDYTVVFHLNNVSPLLHYEISSLVEPISVVIPKHFIEENNIDINVVPTLMDKTPLGSGPWKTVSHVPATSYEWEKSPALPHPYRSTPAFDKVIMYEVPEMGTRLAMGRTGEADIFVLTPDAAPEVEPAGLSVMFVPESNQAVIPFFNTFDPRAPEGHPLQDVRVRKAIAMSIDRDKIVDTIMGGYASYPYGTAVWSTTAGLDPEVEMKHMRENIIPYDQEAAKALLVEAGYPGGEGIPPINWHAYFHMGSPWLPDVALAAANMISGTLGIKFRMSITESSVYGSLFDADGIDDESSVASVGTRRTACRPIPLPRWRSGMDAKNKESYIGGLVKETGEVYWKHPQYFDEWSEFIKRTETPDTAERMAVEHEMKRWLDETYLWPPIVAGGSLWGYNPGKIQEWVGTPCRTEIGRIYETMRPS